MCCTIQTKTIFWKLLPLVPRSAENSDETDLSQPQAEEFSHRQATRTAEREREEERRRMQVEMRKREQELLARIKEQQRELLSLIHI